jgi:hypothetical protein
VHEPGAASEVVRWDVSKTLLVPCVYTYKAYGVGNAPVVGRYVFPPADAAMCSIAHHQATGSSLSPVDIRSSAAVIPASNRTPPSDVPTIWVLVGFHISVPRPVVDRLLLFFEGGGALNTNKEKSFYHSLSAYISTGESMLVNLMEHADHSIDISLLAQPSEKATESYSTSINSLSFRTGLQLAPSGG